jgi:hypothetical protein
VGVECGPSHKVVKYSIYEGRLFVLFCFVAVRSTEPRDASDRALGVFGKLSTRRRDACMGFASMTFWTLRRKSS